MKSEKESFSNELLYQGEPTGGHLFQQGQDWETCGTASMSKRNAFSTISETHWPGGSVVEQLVTYSDQLMVDTSAKEVERRTTTIRDPGRSLASATCAYERICDGAALAWVGVVLSWALIAPLSCRQGLQRECWKSDETLRLADARLTRQVNYSQPPLHVDNKYAAIKHGFCPRELYDWRKKSSGQARAKKCDIEKTSHPSPGRVTIRGKDPGYRIT